MVDARDQLGQGAGEGREGAQAGLQGGGEEGGGDALAGHVGDHQEEAAVGAEEGVEVIAGDGVGGAAGEGDIDARDFGGLRGHEPALDLARDFEVALHGDAVGEFEGEEHDQGEAAEELRLAGVG